MHYNNHLKSINKNTILFEEIKFDKLTCIRAKKDRQIFFHDSEPLVYKIFSSDWEFANQTEIGIDKGFYDLTLIPNFVSLIKDKQDSNRGYVCRFFEESQTLGYYISKNTFRNMIKKYFKQEVSLKKIFFPAYKKNNHYFIELLFTIFSRALITGVIFTELNLIHVWTDGNGYYIYDLDALRELKWLFCEDKNDPEFIRKKVNKDAFNKGLKELIMFHQLKFPFKIVNQKDIQLFWQSFIKENTLDACDTLYEKNVQ